MLEELRTEEIRKPLSTSFSSLEKEARHKRITSSDFAIVISGADYPKLKPLEKLGIQFFGTDIIFAAIILVCEKYNLVMPYADFASGKSVNHASKSERNKIINAQNEVINRIFSLLSFSIANDGKIQILFKEDNVDITDNAVQLAVEDDGRINKLQAFQGLMNRSLSIMKLMSDRVDGLGMIVSSPSQARINGPVIAVNGTSSDQLAWKKNADVMVSDLEGDAVISNAILREIILHQQILERREKLSEHIAKGEIELEPEFEVENWPKHALMEHIKNQAKPIILDETKKVGILCDEQDIRYQTIFRLTTLPFSQLFNNGQELVEKLRNLGVYDDWRNILKLESESFEGYQLQENVVRAVVREQLVIIDNRLKNSPLPVKDILTRTGIFSETGWVMEKDSGNVFAVRYDDSGKEIGRKTVRFGLVEPELATQFHHAFHYIHTPRSGAAYGFFLEDDVTPFSVLAIEPIDRTYKENMLLMHGYDPRYCLDLARLYSRPGTPFNTSSTMFSLVFANLKENRPETQAVLSAFMPTYATGKSMLSGGFDHAVLVKPNRHYFGKKIINGQVVWEHLTKRRTNEASELISIHPDMPMLPVVELMTRLKSPRFKPIPEIAGKMVVSNQ